jgi:hypothetical protein
VSVSAFPDTSAFLSSAPNELSLLRTRMAQVPAIYFISAVDEVRAGIA